MSANKFHTFLRTSNRDLVADTLYLYRNFLFELNHEPNVTHPDFYDFMSLSPETIVHIKDFIRNFPLIHTLDIFMTYVKSSQSERRQIEQDWTDKHTLLNFDTSERSQITSLLARHMNPPSMKAAQQSHLLGVNSEHPMRNRSLFELIGNDGIDFDASMSKDAVNRIMTIVQNATSTSTPLPSSRIAPYVRSNIIENRAISTTLWKHRISMSYTFMFDNGTTLDMVKCYMLQSVGRGVPPNHEIFFQVKSDINTHVYTDANLVSLASLAELMLPHLQKINLSYDDFRLNVIERWGGMEPFVKTVNAFLNVACAKEDIIYEILGSGLAKYLYPHLKHHNMKTLNLRTTFQRISDFWLMQKQDSDPYQIENFNVYLVDLPHEDIIFYQHGGKGLAQKWIRENKSRNGKIDATQQNLMNRSYVKLFVSFLEERPYKKITLYFDHSHHALQKRTSDGLVNSIHAFIDAIQLGVNHLYDIENSPLDRVLTLCAKE